MHADDKQLEEATIPNWCQNVVSFKHADPAMVQRVVAGYNGKGIMQQFHPCPQDLLNTVAGFRGAGTPEQAALEAREAANLAAYGAKNWYDWCVSNWGTKWDISGRDNGEAAVTDDGCCVEFSFDSAWSPPLEFYAKMEELGFVVDAFYYETGMAFCGRYKDGEDDQHEIKGDSDWVEENIPQEINEEFAIAANMSDWESEEENQPPVLEDPGEREVAIHHNDGYNGMGFTGTARQALDVVQTLRPMIDQQAAGETPNWLSDFVFSLETLCQEAGVMDEDFNKI